jgi:hypothetical protein
VIQNASHVELWDRIRRARRPCDLKSQSRVNDSHEEQGALQRRCYARDRDRRLRRLPLTISLTLDHVDATTCALLAIPSMPT